MILKGGIGWAEEVDAITTVDEGGGPIRSSCSGEKVPHLFTFAAVLYVLATIGLTTSNPTNVSISFFVAFFQCNHVEVGTLCASICHQAVLLASLEYQEQCRE